MFCVIGNRPVTSETLKYDEKCLIENFFPITAQYCYDESFIFE